MLYDYEVSVFFCLFLIFHFILFHVCSWKAAQFFCANDALMSRACATYVPCMFPVCSTYFPRMFPGACLLTRWS